MPSGGDLPDAGTRTGIPARRTGGSRMALRRSVLALISVLLASSYGGQVAPVLAAAAQPARPQAMPVSFPAPMRQPGSAAAHLAPSGASLDPRFAAPARRCPAVPAGHPA